MLKHRKPKLSINLFSGLDLEIQKKSFFVNVKPIFLNLWSFTNFSLIFPFVVLVFEFGEF
jgi:hypothetical protein